MSTIDPLNHFRTILLFRSFRDPLFFKPVIGHELFFAVSYRKSTLTTMNVLKKIAKKGMCSLCQKDYIFFVN